MPEAFTPELSLVSITVSSRPRDRSLDDRARAPGWFDSSWELRSGLDVKEGWFGDDSLNGWIESFLFAQRASGRTASPSASTAIA
jgi:hypothetical protein